VSPLETEDKKKTIGRKNFLLKSSPSSSLLGSIMDSVLAAVESGDAKKVAELIRQDPGFKVNMAMDEYGSTLLHYACLEDSRSAVIPLLLAHPDIDINLKNKYGYTPFFLLVSMDTPPVFACS